MVQKLRLSVGRDPNNTHKEASAVLEHVECFVNCTFSIDELFINHNVRLTIQIVVVQVVEECLFWVSNQVTKLTFLRHNFSQILRYCFWVYLEETLAIANHKALTDPFNSFTHLSKVFEQHNIPDLVFMVFVVSQDIFFGYIKIESGKDSASSCWSEQETL